MKKFLILAFRQIIVFKKLKKRPFCACLKEKFLYLTEKLAFALEEINKKLNFSNKLFGKNYFPNKEF